MAVDAKERTTDLPSSLPFTLPKLIDRRVDYNYDAVFKVGPHINQ